LIPTAETYSYFQYVFSSWARRGQDYAPVL